MFFNGSLEFIFFFVAWCFTGISIFVSEELFKLLEDKTPKYYESIGKPKNNTLSLYRKCAVVDFDLMIVRGLPANFPKDKTMRKLAQITRVMYMLTMLAFILFIVFVTGK